jgi:hypothetical protein
MVSRGLFSMNQHRKKCRNKLIEYESKKRAEAEREICEASKLHLVYSNILICIIITNNDK